MRILYIVNARIPSEEAHTYQILKMCEAFKRRDIDVSLIVPYRVQTSHEMREIKDVWKHYGISERFNIRRLPNIDLLWIGRYWLSRRIHRAVFMVQAVSFIFLAVLYSLFKSADVYYTREFLCALLWRPNRVAKKRVFYEAHSFPTGIIKKLRIWTQKRTDGLVVITEEMRKLYRKEGIPEEKFLVAPNGVDLRRFADADVKELSRSELALVADKKVICYAGSFYDWKGTHSLGRSMKSLSDRYVAYFVGGTDLELKSFREFIKKNDIPSVVTVGYVPPSVVLKYLAASDILVLPNVRKAHSAYTSPLKLFEYMAAKRPIVASDLPAIREILRHEQNALLVEPDNPVALAEAIERVSTDEALTKRLVQNAFQDVQHYTWDKRADKIIHFIATRGITV